MRGVRHGRGFAKTIEGEEVLVRHVSPRAHVDRATNENIFSFTLRASGLKDSLLKTLKSSDVFFLHQLYKILKPTWPCLF